MSRLFVLLLVMVIVGTTSCKDRTQSKEIPEDRTQSKEIPEDGTQSKEIPLEIRASHLGWFTNKNGWTLTVDGSGKAKLALDAQPKLPLKKIACEKSREFRVSHEKMAELRKALNDEKFFELPGTIGKVVPDGGRRALAVKIGKNENKITINFLHQSSLTGADLDQARRAIRIWAKLRALFDDQDAIDSRETDERLLK